MPQRLDFAQWDLVNVPIGRKKLGIIDGTTGSGVGAGTGFTTAPAGGSNIVGILGTNGLALNVPAYLTTALGTNASSAFAGTGTSATNASITLNTAGLAISVAPPAGGGAGTGFTSASTAGANIVGTLDTNGLSVGVPAYLTTAQAPGAYLTTAMQSDASSAFAGTGATIAGGSMTVNTAGVNISLPAYLTTAQPPGAYLTTAMASDASSAFAGTNGSISGGSLTLNTAGLTINLPAYLTTALASDASSAFAGTGFSTTSTAGVNIVGTLGTNGLSMGVPSFLTTYVNDLTSGRAGVGETVGTTAGTDLAMTVDTNGVSIAYPKWITTYANDLTSGRAGTGFSSTSTAGVAIVGTLNTAGLSVGVPNYLTTYVNDLTSGRAGVGTTLATTIGTDIKMTLNTDGLNLSYPKYITTYVNDLTSDRAGTVTGATGCSVTANTSGISVNVPSAAGVATLSRFNNIQMFNASTTMAQSNSFYVFPITLPQPISIDFIRFAASVNFTSTSLASSAVNDATGTTTSGEFQQGFNLVFYTNNVGAASRSLSYKLSTVGGFTWRFSVSQASTSRASRATIWHTLSYCKEGVITSTGTTIETTLSNCPIHSSQWTNMSASKWFDVKFATSLAAGNWYIAMNRISSTTGGKNLDVNASIYCVSQTNLTFSPPDAASTLVGAAFGEVLGNWTTNAAATTASIGIDSISASTSYYIPWLQMERYA